MQQAVTFRRAPLSVKPSLSGCKARSKAIMTQCSGSNTLQDNSCRPHAQRNEARHDSEGSLAVCMCILCLHVELLISRGPFKFSSVLYTENQVLVWQVQKGLARNFGLGGLVAVLCSLQKSVSA